MKRMISVFLSVCLLAALLCGCGSGGGEKAAPSPAAAEESDPQGMTFRQAAPTPTREPSATPDPDALQEYAADGVGTFWLPAGFDMALAESSDPLPASGVTFTRSGVTVYAERIGYDDFRDAGETVPADLESFAASGPVRQDVPEDVSFETDEFGSLFADWIDSDGMTVYYVLKAGTDSYGVAVGRAPAGDAAVGEIPLWLSKAAIN